MTKYFPTRIIATLVSGKYMLPEKTGLYQACGELFDYLTQDEQTNLAFFNRGATWCQSVLGEQYPQFIDANCGLGREAVEAYIAKIESQYGTELPVQPADRPFMNLSPHEEWANAKGLSPDEAKKTVIEVNAPRTKKR